MSQVLKSLMFLLVVMTAVYFPASISMAVTDEAIEQYAQQVEKENELAKHDVISEEIKQRLIDTAIEVLKIGENYTPENYAEQYDKVAEMSAPETQLTYKEFRQKHMDENLIPGVHLTFVPDMNSIRLEIKTKYGTEFDYAEVYVQGDRTIWTTAEPEKKTKKIQYRIWMMYDSTQALEKQITHGGWTIEEAKPLKN